MYENSIAGTPLASFNIREGKLLLKPVLDKQIDIINYFAHETEQPNSFFLGGAYFTSEISDWMYYVNSEQVPWDFQKSVSQDLDLVSAIEGLDIYNEVAKIKRVNSSSYKEFTQEYDPELISETQYEIYHFDDLTQAINFDDQYVSKTTYYVYEVEDEGCGDYVISDEYSYIRTVDGEVHYDEILITKTNGVSIRANATLKSNCKLQVPYSNSSFGYYHQPDIFESLSGWQDYIDFDPYVNAQPYCKVKIEEGVKLDVFGTVNIGAFTGTKSNSLLNQVYVKTDESGNITSGGFGELIINGEVNVKAGGTLNSYGYVTGSGEINAEEGSLITDLFVINNWPGGTNASKYYRESCIFNEYTISNIRCVTNIYYGAYFKALANIYVPTFSMSESEPITLVGPEDEALFSLKNTGLLGDDSYIQKSWYFDNDLNTGITKIDMHGDVRDNNIELHNYNLCGTYFPAYKMQIIVSCDLFSISENKFMIMPGSQFIVKENATVLVEENGGFAIMETMNFNDANKYLGFDYPAICNIYGNLTIYGEGVGQIIAHEQSEINHSSSKKYADVKYGPGYLSTVVTSPNYFSIYYTNTEETYISVVFETNGGTSCGSQTILKETYVELIDEPIRIGYIFDGWYTTPDFQRGTEFYFAGDNATIVSDSLTIYAKWKPIIKEIQFFVNDTIYQEELLVQYETINAPELPTLESYLFVGWSLTPDGDIVEFPYQIIEDTFFYAKWEEDPVYNNLKECLGNEENIQIINDADYPMVIYENDSIMSTNKGVGYSDSKIQLCFNLSGKLSFDYNCSSETSYDKFIIYKNDTEIDFFSGETVGQYQIKVEIGDIIVLSFEKDGSVSQYNDQLILSNFNFVRD